MKNGYNLRVDLDRIKPPIWRRFEIPSGITLGQLHQIIQDVMGWMDSHLHSFEISGKEYGPIDEFDEDDQIDENSVTVEKVLRGGVKSFKYIYDFGDYWVHTIKVESETESIVRVPRVLKGKRCCPLEDCGGPWGYADVLEAVSNPEGEKGAELGEWIGEDYDPERFDISEVNEILTDGRY